MNPGGIPPVTFDDIRKAMTADRSKFVNDLSLPFSGYNKSGAKISEGVREAFWRQGMQASIHGTYDCIKAQSETAMTDDLKKINVPTLILHGELDQLVPVADTAVLSARIIRDYTLKIYPDASNGMTVTSADRVNHDLLAVLQS